MINALDRQLDGLLELEPEQRPTFFQMRSEAEREAIMALWARSPRLRVTDVVALPQPYQAELISFVVGNPQLGRPGVDTIFTVEPTGKPVKLERGTENNQRRFRLIAEPTSMNAKHAVHAMLCYGPYADMETNRGKLREVGYGPEPDPVVEPVVVPAAPAPKGETPKARKVKEAFLSLGPGRTLEAVSLEYYPKSATHPAPHIAKWAMEHDWARAAVEYDEEHGK